MRSSKLDNEHDRFYNISFEDDDSNETDKIELDEMPFVSHDSSELFKIPDQVNVLHTPFSNQSSQEIFLHVKNSLTKEGNISLIDSMKFINKNEEIHQESIAEKSPDIEVNLPRNSHAKLLIFALKCGNDKYADFATALINKKLHKLNRRKKIHDALITDNAQALLSVLRLSLQASSMALVYDKIYLSIIKLINTLHTNNDYKNVITLAVKEADEQAKEEFQILMSKGINSIYVNYNLIDKSVHPVWLYNERHEFDEWTHKEFSLVLDMTLNYRSINDLIIYLEKQRKLWTELSDKYIESYVYNFTSIQEQYPRMNQYKAEKTEAIKKLWRNREAMPAICSILLKKLASEENFISFIFSGSVDPGWIDPETGDTIALIAAKYNNRAVAAAIQIECPLKRKLLFSANHWGVSFDHYLTLESHSNEFLKKSQDEIKKLEPFHDILRDIEMATHSFEDEWHKRLFEKMIPASLSEKTGYFININRFIASAPNSSEPVESLTQSRNLINDILAWCSDLRKSAFNHQEVESLIAKLQQISNGVPETFLIKNTIDQALIKLRVLVKKMTTNKEESPNLLSEMEIKRFGGWDVQSMNTDHRFFASKTKTKGTFYPDINLCNENKGLSSNSL